MADIPIVDPREQRTAALDPAAAARHETLTVPPPRGNGLPIDQASPIGTCDARTPHPYTDHELAWRPDPKSQSQSAEQWRQDNAKLRTQPLDMDGNGYHKVVSGDDLSTIAMRSLRDQGKDTGHDAIKAEMNRIVSLNVQAYPGLEKNPDLLRNGDSLRIADCNGHPNVQLQTPAPDTAPGGRYGRHGDVPGPTQAAPPPVDQGPGGRYGRYGDVPGNGRVVTGDVPVVAPPVQQTYAPAPPRQEVQVVRQPLPVQGMVMQPGYQYAPGYYGHRMNPAAAIIGTVASALTGGFMPGVGVPMWGDRHRHPFPMIASPAMYPPAYAYQGYVNPNQVGYTGYPPQVAAGYTGDTTYDYTTQPQIVYVAGAPQPQYYPYPRRHR